MHRTPRILLSAAAAGGSVGAAAVALAFLPQPAQSSQIVTPKPPVPSGSSDGASYLALEREHAALVSRTEALAREVTAATHAMLAAQSRAAGPPAVRVHITARAAVAPPAIRAARPARPPATVATSGASGASKQVASEGGTDD